LLIEPSSPEPPPGGGDFSRIPVTMSFRGTYEEMQDFLLRLRNLVRLVTVNEVTYCRFPAPVSDADCPIEETGEGEETTAANSRAENLLTIKVEAEVYVQPAAGETTGSATTPTREATAPREGTSRGGGSNK
jgi:type IV pilus assembly protein PilO